MPLYILKRLSQSLATLWLVLTVVFFLSYLTGDPVAVMFPDLSLEELEEMRVRLGLDGSVFSQYLTYMSNILRGDLGQSMTFRRPVIDVLGDHYMPTVQLVLASVALAAVIGVALGAFAARRPGSARDRFGTLLAAILKSIPPFWSGIMLVMIFAVSWGLLPTSGYGRAVHLVLPSVTLALYSSAIFIRVTRTSVVEKASEFHLLAAKARGVRSRALFRKHQFRNALPPVLASIGYRTAELAGGAVVIEKIFGWPGLGSVMLNAVFRRDYLLIQGCVLLVAFGVIVVNLLVDILMPLLDRRLSANA